MRQLRLITVALLGVAITSCGSGKANVTQSSRANAASHSSVTVPSDEGTSHSASQSSVATSKQPNKNDSDGDKDGDNDDYGYGHVADTTDRATIIALLGRYYAAAAANNGPAACSLIYTLLAEEIPEVYGEYPGPADLQGKTCGAVMTKLFSLHHRELRVDQATLKVLAVRVRLHRAIAVMSFMGRPQRDILLHSEHGGWKIDELLDSNLS